jgi:hypothetical protein
MSWNPSAFPLSSPAAWDLCIAFVEIHAISDTAELALLPL